VGGVGGRWPRVPGVRVARCVGRAAVSVCAARSPGRIRSVPLRRQLLQGAPGRDGVEVIGDEGAFADGERALEEGTGESRLVDQPDTCCCVPWSRSMTPSPQRCAAAHSWRSALGRRSLPVAWAAAAVHRVRSRQRVRRRQLASHLRQRLVQQDRRHPAPEPIPLQRALQSPRRQRPVPPVRRQRPAHLGMGQGGRDQVLGPVPNLARRPVTSPADVSTAGPASLPGPGGPTGWRRSIGRHSLGRSPSPAASRSATSAP
jgi:hypothetical protein